MFLLTFIKRLVAISRYVQQLNMRCENTGFLLVIKSQEVWFVFCFYNRRKAKFQIEDNANKGVIAFLPSSQTPLHFVPWTPS